MTGGAGGLTLSVLRLVRFVWDALRADRFFGRLGRSESPEVGYKEKMS